MALIETFTRSQLAAISLIFIGFQRISRDFMDFGGPGLVLAVISLIFMDFLDFHEIL